MFDNEHLMKRDQTDFSPYWELLGLQERVEYHVKYPFTLAVNELVIVDEADAIMFENPLEFKEFISKTACLCFTATPASSSVEKKVADALQFKQYNYIFGEEENAEKNSSALPKEDRIVAAATIKDKAAYIKGLSTDMPVLVFCEPTLTEELISIGCSPLVVDHNVDPAVLRQLDERDQATGAYRVVVSETQFGMRGLDYRSKNVKMALVIAKSFENQREAVQGFNRVGRFGD